MTTTAGAPTIPARLLKVGDRIRLGDTVLDVTAAYHVADRVELSFMAAEHESWAYATDVLPPDLEVVLVRTYAQEASPL